MDDKYKFKINKEELKDEEIRKYQNFDGLMTEFRKTRIEQKKVVPFHKRRAVVYTMVAAAAFLFLVGTVGYFSLFIGNENSKLAEARSSANDFNMGSDGQKETLPSSGKSMKNIATESSEAGNLSDAGLPLSIKELDGGKADYKTIPEETEEGLAMQDLGNGVSKSSNDAGAFKTESASNLPERKAVNKNNDKDIYDEEDVVKMYEIAEVEEVIDEIEMEYVEENDRYYEEVMEAEAPIGLQEDYEEIVEKDDDAEHEIFMIVEEQPEFPGGEAAMLEFIYKNISYPDLARDNSIEGTCYLNFVVQEDGSISDIKIMRDIGAGCGDAAKSIIKKMPNWKPGKQRGRTVPVRFNLPIKFQLDGSFKPAKAFEKSKPKTTNFKDKTIAPVAENDFIATTEKPLSTFSIDVDNASYSLLRKNLNYDKMPNPHAIRIEEMINYFEYDYPKPQGEHPLNIYTELTTCPWNTNHNLAMIALQGKDLDKDRMPKNNLVFLLDVSGSMNDHDKLPLVKKSVRMLMDKMRPDDRMAIVVYAGAAGVVLPSTPFKNKGEILTALENLNAGGSTAGGEGIDLAYKIAQEHFIKDGNNRIILATDGDFNVGKSSDEELVQLIEEKRKSSVFLTVLGFGTGNFKDVKMEKLSNAGNGNYAYIDNVLEAKKVLNKEMLGTLYTIAKDVKFQVEFNPHQVRAYRLIGYVNRKLRDRDFNNDKKDAGELGANHQVTALYEIVPIDSNSEVMGSGEVDPLKYQTALQYKGNFDNEYLNVKLRYKQPTASTSVKIEKILSVGSEMDLNASYNMQFASSVAAFGLLLTRSKYKGKADYPMVLYLAKSSKGSDQEGYRSEFIRLVEKTQLIDN